MLGKAVVAYQANLKHERIVVRGFLQPIPPDDSAHFLWVSGMEIIEYAEARKRGLKFYFTGRKCKHGHLSKRYSSTGQCCECIKVRTAEQVAAGYFKELYSRDPEGICKRQKEKRRNNRDKGIITKSTWAKRNPAAARVIKHNYKARRKATIESGMTTKELRDWDESQVKACYWCGIKCDQLYHIDHYIPLSKGGLHERENLVISCPTCNLRKNAKDPYEWAQEIGRLF